MSKWIEFISLCMHDVLAELAYIVGEKLKWIESEKKKTCPIQTWIFQWTVPYKLAIITRVLPCEMAGYTENIIKTVNCSAANNWQHLNRIRVFCRRESRHEITVNRVYYWAFMLTTTNGQHYSWKKKKSRPNDPKWAELSCTVLGWNNS